MHPFTHLTRYSAFTTHLLASIAIFAALFGVVIVAWYPAPLFQIDGGWQGLQIVALVDVVLGPLLTLIVFRPGKPGLKLDMAIIIAIQLGALAYGVWTMHHNRPAFLVFADDLIEPIPVSLAEEMDPSGQLLERFPGSYPVRVALAIPTDPVAGAEYLLEKVRSETPLHLHHQDYVPMAEWWPAVVDDSLDIDYYVSHKPEWQTQLRLKLAETGRTKDAVAFLPIKGRYKSGIIIADIDSGEFVGFLDIPFDPALARKKRLLKDRLAPAMGS
jgi:hypothetical protein